MVGLVQVCVSDVAGIVRGKGFPMADLERRRARGIGWTPTNVQITCFDTIAPSPWGSTGDLVLRPDPERLTQVEIDDGPPLRLALGTIEELDGTPWECCLRSHLMRLADAFREATGLTIRASFEHEMTLHGLSGGPGFSAGGFREGQRFGEALLEALRAAGMEPDSFLREYGPAQYEVTLAPSEAVRAADDAVLLREIAREVARAQGLRASFAPMVRADAVGNGVHVHLSFWDGERPATRDPDGPAGLGSAAGMAAAGIVAHMPEITALTAACAASYLRLVPHRWSAAFANLADRDREAGLRICPLTAPDEDGRAQQANIEYRAADASASPWLALAAIIGAALAGARSDLPCPEPTTGDLAELDAAALAASGVRPLPRSLPDALALLEGSEVASWFPGRLVPVYLEHKRAELAVVDALDAEAMIAAYAAVY